MIKFELTDELKQKAKERADKFKDPAKRSFMKGTRNYLGMIGEEVVRSYFINNEHIDNSHYDFKISGKNVDVKSRIIGVDPKPGYEIAIHIPPWKEKDLNKIDVEIYIIVCVSRDYNSAWMVGWISKADLIKKADYMHAGYKMPQGGHYKASAYRIYFKDLNLFHKTDK